MKQKYLLKTHYDKLLFLLSLLLFCQSSVYGQTRSNPLQTPSLYEDQNVGTPATSALVKNIVYPVNYSTGLPEIKIPLYEIQSGDVTLPIYLTYHASGIKLSDVAGWTGLGWNLVAEPMITRTIRGMEDEVKTRTCRFNKNDFQSQSYVAQMAKGNCEYPDEYYYRLPDKQGMFMYAMEPVDPTQQFLPLPYENIRIDWLGKSFRITDDDGTVYKFDGGNELGGGYLQIVGWKASSIVASNRKDSIAFVYDTQRNQYLVKTHHDYMVVIDDSSEKHHLYTKRDGALGATEYLPDEWMQEPIIYSTVNDKTISFQRDEEGELMSDESIPYATQSTRNIDTRSQPLREIRFNNGKVIFTQEPGQPRLQTITVYDLSGNFVKQISFNYTTNNPRIRHRYYLASLSITDRNGMDCETYRFNYNSPQYLPEPGNRSIDYWGYYNGTSRPDNETLVPRQTINTLKWYRSQPNVLTKEEVSLNFGSKITREPDEKSMMHGMLSSITYPTGGRDEFIYEAHRYKTPAGIIKMAGGLRIRQIKTWDDVGEAKVRTFTYGVLEDGTGYSLREDILEYFQLQQTMYLGDPFVATAEHGKEFYGPEPDVYYTSRYRTFFGQPTRPITHAGGSSVMYEYVTEYNGTPENNSGKTQYVYALDPYIPMPEVMNTIQGDHHNSWRFGHLVTKTVYRNDNGKYIRMEEINNSYSSSKKELGKIFVGEAFANCVIRKAASGYVPREALYNNTYRRTEIAVGTNLLLHTGRRVYTNGKEVYQGTEYEYDDPATIFPTRITEVGSDTLTHVTTLKYPRDYGNVSPYKEMVERNILVPEVKKEYTWSGQYLQIETPFVSPYKEVYKPGSLIVRHTPSGESDTRFTYLYDEYGRKIQATKDGKENVVYLYGYKNQYVIARIENATYEEVVAKLEKVVNVRTMSFAEAPFDEHWESLHNLRRAMPDARVTIYSYKPLVGISSITDPFGLTTGYDYDDMGRLLKTYLIRNNRREPVQQIDYHYANQ